MGQNTKIEWCDHTFNPWIGCTKVSPACDHCYAEAMMDHRLGRVQWGPHGKRERTSAANWKKPLAWNRAAQKAGTRPFVFCASLADVFDNQVPKEWRRDLFALIRKTPNLIWLLLTKRPQNIGKMLSDFGGLPRNVALGTSAGTQVEADRNIPALLNAAYMLAPAFLFLSAEPLLEALDLRSFLDPCPRWCKRGCTASGDEECAKALPLIDWVIVGGESGKEARPVHPDWVRSLRSQCADAETPFFFKQWGEWKAVGQMAADEYAPLYKSNRKARGHEDQADIDDIYGTTCKVPCLCLRVDGRHCDELAPMAWRQGTVPQLGFRIGKDKSGRVLDGVVHDAFPHVRGAE